MFVSENTALLLAGVSVLVVLFCVWKEMKLAKDLKENLKKADTPEKVLKVNEEFKKNRKRNGMVMFVAGAVAAGFVVYYMCGAGKKKNRFNMNSELPSEELPSFSFTSSDLKSLSE